MKREFYNCLYFSKNLAKFSWQTYVIMIECFLSGLYAWIADVAQSVERRLGKAEVSSSSLVISLLV